MFTTKKLTQDHSQSEVSTERLNMTSEASVISPHGQARVLLRVKWFEDTWSNDAFVGPSSLNTQHAFTQMGFSLRVSEGEKENKREEGRELLPSRASDRLWMCDSAQPDGKRMSQAKSLSDLIGSKNKREMPYIDLWRTVVIVLTYGMYSQN